MNAEVRMSHFNQRLFARLDAAAEHTGMPALARHDIRRRHLRWLPILALALAAGGWAWGLARPSTAWLGYGAITLGFAIGVFLPLFGPIKPWGGPRLADEFDRQVRQKAFLYGFAAVSFAAIFGIWTVLGLAVLGDWSRSIVLGQIANLNYLLFVLYLAVPTLHASWTTRPVEED